MQINQVVVNASPLIVLFKSEQAQLLNQLFTDICTPMAVVTEIMSAQNSDLAKQQLPETDWLRYVDQEIDPVIQNWDLGAGESTVLSFALEHPDYRAVIDDSAARRCARSLGISTLGTGGILVLAKRRGLIPSATQAIERVREVGLWLSDDIVNLLKHKAGE